MQRFHDQYIMQKQRDNMLHHKVLSTMLPSSKPKQYYHYNSIQQIHSKILKNTIQQETEEYHHHPLKKDNLSIASSTKSHHLQPFVKPYKKFIHKEDKNRHKPKRERDQDKYIYSKSIKRNIILEDITTKSFKITKIESIFDWMREKSSRLKITKNSYYRALLIFQILYDLDNKIIISKRLISLTCAALSLGTKFQCSKNNYLQEIYKINMQRVTKEDIKDSEKEIIQTLYWKIPINVFVEEEIDELITIWNQYATFAMSNSKNSHIQLKIQWQEPSMHKLYIEILEILDFIIIRKSQELLKLKSIKMPFLISLYVILSRNNGDFQLKHYTWPIFQVFLSKRLFFQEQKIIKLKMDINSYFIELNLGSVLSQIPLNINYSGQNYKKNQQFYIVKLQNAV